MTSITQKEAESMIEVEVSKLPKIKEDFIDTIIKQLTDPKDKVSFANANDGMHLFINSVHMGYFMRDKMGLVFRTSDDETRNKLEASRRGKSLSSGARRCVERTWDY